MSDTDASDGFKCPVCNGNVRTGPDDVVITCTFCGTITATDGAEIRDHLMEDAVDAGVREKKFREFLDENKGFNKSLVKRAQVVENLLIYVPVWTAKVKADSWFKGFKTVQVPVTRTRTVRDSQGRTRTETYTTYEPGYVPVQDEIHTDTDERLLGRKGARIYGLEDYLEDLDLSDTEPWSWEKIKDLEPTVLNAEIGSKEFELAVHGRVSDRHRSMAKSGLTELFDCRTTTNVRGTTYFQAPFSLIRYTFQGDLYKCAMDGHSGKVVLGEIPITKGQRIMWGLIGFIGTVLAGFATDILLAGINLEEMMNIALGGLGAVVGVIMAVFGFKTLLMTQREKEG